MAMQSFSQILLSDDTYSFLLGLLPPSANHGVIPNSHFLCPMCPESHTLYQLKQCKTTGESKAALALCFGRGPTRKPHTPRFPEPGLTLVLHSDSSPAPPPDQNRLHVFHIIS